MHTPLSTLVALAVVAAIATPATSIAQTGDLTNVGALTCNISGGISLIITSQKSVNCIFTPAQPGPRL
jgi:hypothetical protein